MALLRSCKNVWQIITQHKQLFYIGLCIKLLLGTFFAGDYLIHLFTPFLKYSTTQSFTTAYDYFTTYCKGNEFPYPYVMQVMLGIPKFMLSFLSGRGASVNYIDIVSIRITLLVADIVILYVLLQWLPKHTKRVLWLYWFSPILMYINYVHGQLDVLPVALLLLSIYLLLKSKIFPSILFLVLAIGCKTSILLAVPFLVIAIYKNNAVSKMVFWRSMVGLLVGIFLILFPAFFSKGYWLMVFNNSEQAKLFSTYLSISGTSLFLVVPALYFILVIRFATYWQVSRELLLMYLGFAFGLITIFIAANQGWYYWCLPFFIYFVIKENRFARLPYITVTIFYFLHFALINNSDYQRVWQLISPTLTDNNNLYASINAKGFNATLWSNVASTLLQTTLLAFCYGIYRYGIQQIKQYKMLHQPYLIGISGDSASGKTTLATLLQQLFSVNNSTIINGDDMHKWERGNAQYQNTTHLNPSANDLHTNVLHFLQLAKGNAIRRSAYNHHSGLFDVPKKIASSKVLIFEGLHTYYLQEQANLFDLCIYTKPAETLRQQWKVDRDVQERGHSVTKVLQSIEDRKADAATYIAQQENDADIIFSIINKENNITIQCKNSYYIDTLVANLQRHNIAITHQYTDKNQLVTITTSIGQEIIYAIGTTYIDKLEELGFGNVQWASGTDGIMQLFVVQIIFYKMQLSALQQSDIL